MVLSEKIGLKLSVLADDIRRKNLAIEAMFKDKDKAPKEMIDKAIGERNDMIAEEESRFAAFDALRAVGR